MLLLKKQTLKLIFLFSFLFTQSQTVKNFTISNGLAGNDIKCIYKDSNGLMWIATGTGLCTYDGIRFNIIGEDKGLKHNLIWKITEDDKKNIWLSVFGNGIAKYDGKKFTYYNEKNGLINNSVRSLYYSKKYNCMVFGTEDGLSVFDGKNFKNFKIKIFNHTKTFQVNFISEYKNKILFGANHDKIYELKVNSKDFQKTKISSYLSLKTKNYSGLIFENYFFGHTYSNDFEVFNLKTNQISNLGNCPVIWDYAVDNQKNIYSTCWDVNSPRGGLFCASKNRLINLSEKLKLPTTIFWCLYFDNLTNLLWVGSVEKGLFIIDLSQKINYESSGIDKPEINSFCIDNKNNIWLGGNNFLAKKELEKTIKINNINLRSKILKFIKNRFDYKSNVLKNFLKSSNDFVCHSLKKDEFGNIWAMTNYGLINFDENLNIVKFQNYDISGGKFDFIDSKKILLSQTYNFSYIIDVENLNGLKKLFYQGEATKLSASKIFKSKNVLWISSSTKGLLLYEKGNLKSMNDLGFLNEENIKDAIVDSKQNIIAGTVNGKVYFSTWNNNQLSHFKILSPDKDLIGNSIFFIRQYGNYYFIGTNKGLNIIKNYKLFKFIDETEFFNQEIYTDAQIDYKNKKLIISTNNGLINVDIKKIISKQKVNYPIQILEIKVNNKPIEKTSILELKHYENNIEISFNSNNIYNASKNRYRYKIIGLTNEWSSYSNQNQIKLLGLNNGNYQILIEGKNIGTNESIKSINLKVKVLPPFWKTSWFIIVSVIIVLLLFVIYIKRKISKIKYKADLEKRIAETKLQALQSQMNPHFVFNAMNSIQNFVIDNNTDDALWYIGEFSKLIRQTLDFSSKSTVRLEEEIEYLKRYIGLENFRRKKKVIWVIDIDDSIDVHDIEIPPMLIQPIVENVFVHAFDTTIESPKLKIEFSKFENNIICIVTDNGKGLVNSNKFSKGLKLVEERIQLSDSINNNRISFIQVLNGTSVKLEISIR